MKKLLLRILEFVQQHSSIAGCIPHLYHSAQLQPYIPKDSQLITNLIPCITGNPNLIITNIDLNTYTRLRNQAINP